MRTILQENNSARFQSMYT